MRPIPYALCPMTRRPPLPPPRNADISLRSCAWPHAHGHMPMPHCPCFPQIFRFQGHNLACDWWSLGVFIFEMLAGADPFVVDDDDVGIGYCVESKIIDYMKTGEGLDFPDGFDSEAADIVRTVHTHTRYERPQSERACRCYACMCTCTRMRTRSICSWPSGHVACVVSSHVVVSAHAHVCACPHPARLCSHRQRCANCSMAAPRIVWGPPVPKRIPSSRPSIGWSLRGGKCQHPSCRR